MASANLRELVDAGLIILNRENLRSMVKNCAISGRSLKITNTVLFFDDDHPEYAAIFDERVSVCDASNVNVIIEGADDDGLLPADFLKESSKHGEFQG
jgi:hypothetical protein